MPQEKQTNRLANEKSPYLLQHADNPVNWYPWGDEAFDKAKKENKPIFLSIGYSTCHWCHVMEHESFEDAETAKVLNEHFISIKVDREERPDIDHIYMTAVTAMTGQGGWPLSVFLTPDKKPFYGGTYFPPEAKWGTPGFTDLLLSIDRTWKSQKEKVLESSDSITEVLQQRLSFGAEAGTTLGKETLDAAYRQLSASYDNQFGGFGNAPKFPMGHTLSFVLRYWKRSSDQEALSMVEQTLKAMAKGGMYDQLGGGFHRYSTDRTWQVPHFEKMLYDQAILARVYLEAYQATGDKFYAQVAREIFEYVLRDMQASEGGFFSAEDADSFDPQEYAGMTPDPKLKHKKHEGAFYLWTADEIAKILGEEDAKIFNYRYGVKPNGNAKYDPHGEFNGKNIIFVEKSLEETAENFKKEKSEIESIIQEAKKKLYDVQKRRPRSGLDDKVLVDWNGLMISSLAFGSRVLEEPRYREAAEKSADFILNKLIDQQGRLLHRYREGESGILGTLEDYAFFIHGLIDLYEATFNLKYLQEAKRLSEEMDRLFWDAQKGGFFFTASDSEKMIIAQKEIYDGAIPSGNSVAALDLLRLSHITFQGDLEKKTTELFNSFAPDVAPRPGAHTQLLWALDYAIGPSMEIVIAAQTGDPAVDGMVKSVFKRFLPNRVLILRPAEDKEAKQLILIAPFVENQRVMKNKTTGYVCVNHICKLPVTEIKEFDTLLEN